jgi:uncharacterized membrane protein
MTPSSAIRPAAGPSSNRSTLLKIATIVLVSIALHVVPQAMRTIVTPAWSMLMLMMLDAMLIALLARSWAPVRVAALIAVVLALTVALRQNEFAAAPSIAFNLLLAAVFGATLRRGSTPLLVRIATAAFPLDMSPAFERYLRGLTIVWVVFFVVMAMASLVLALSASYAAWSLFVNVLTWPLTAAVFLAEWAFRRIFRRHFPAHAPLQILASIFSYRGPMGPGAGRTSPAAMPARSSASSE